VYKLVVIDLDGTLLNDDNQIDKLSKMAVEALCERHIKVAFASDRSSRGTGAIRDKFDLCDFLDYSLYFNGACVVDNKNNKMLINKYLSGNDFIPLSKLVTEDDIYIYAFNAEKIIVSEMNTYAYEDAYKNNTSIVSQSREALTNAPIIYKYVIAGNSEKLDRIEASITSDLKKNYSIVRTYKNRLEFYHSTANKGQAMKILTELNGCLLEETMAIGDAGNDIEMIISAGQGIAMGNATDEVKSKADYVSATNNNGGVAKALEKFILDEDLRNKLKPEVSVM